MLNNQLSAKELYSTNPSQFLQRSGSRSEPEDSAFNLSQTMSQSNSQMMSSQMENSQSSSFDRFSQMMMSQQGLSQQTENANNPQRFYLKYMSKAPLFNKESDTNPVPRKRSFQEQLESNKQKAKERDDRDLINTFINLVKECTEEVKSAATDIRNDVDKNILESANQFGNLIQKINEDLKNYRHTLLGAIKVREDQQVTQERMQQDIAARDAKIEVLEMQLDVAKQERDERLVQSLLEAYTEQQKMNRDQIDKMKEEQQTFCKIQMEQLQQDQQKYLLGCEVENKAAKAKAVVAANRRDDQGSGQAGLRPPVTGVDNRPRSWQGVPQYEQTGCPSQPSSRFQENPVHHNMLNLMHPITTTSHHNEASVSHMVNPTSASFSHHGNIISLPTASSGWSAPLGIQNREPYLQSSIQCNPSYSFNQPPVSHQTRPTIPNLQTGNNFDQDSRPSGFIPQQGIQAAFPMMSPSLGTSNPSRQWNINKWKPSPVAAVAPQVKPKEKVHPTQVEINDENRQEPISEPSQTTLTTRKKGRKRYQVAVKTKRQSARVKAKQNSTSCERKNSMMSDQVNQPQHRQHRRQTSKKVPKVDSTQPGQTKIVHLQRKVEDKDVYEYKEPERKKVLLTKKKVHGKQNYRSQQKSPSSNQNNQAQLMYHGRKTSKKISNSAPKQSVQTKVIHHQPIVADEDVYEYTEPEQEKIIGIRKKVRGKQGHRNLHKSSALEALALQPSQDGIFSQKRLTTYVRCQDSGCGNTKTPSSLLGNSKQNVKARQQRGQKANIICDGSSSEDEEFESQNTNIDESEDVVTSQDETDDDIQEEVIEEQPIQSMRKMQVKRKTKQQSTNEKHTDKPVGCPKQHQVSQLDTMLPYSDQEDSSEEMIFSLKLPDSSRHQDSSRKQQAKKPQTVEQVVPVTRSPNILSTPYLHVQEEDSDNESTGTTYSVCVGSGRKLSRQTERKRCLSHYTGSSAAAMAEITNSLRLHHHKIRRVSSYHQ